MTREQIKKIVRLTESIVNKRLNENRSSKIPGDSFSSLENALVDNPKTNKQYERFVNKIMKRNDNAELWDDVSLADYELTYKFMKDLASKNGINESISRTSNKRLNENGSYYRTEFSKISAAPGPTQPKIQIMDDHAKTKWIDLNNDSVPELIGWLQRTF